MIGEIEIQVDPTRLHLREGPQHLYLMTATIDEIKCRFDSHEKANIAWDAPHGIWDYDDKVLSNYRGLEQSCFFFRNGYVEFQRVVYNPVTQVIVYGG